jgi:hypothetical protein
MAQAECRSRGMAIKDLLAITDRLGEFPQGRLSLPVRAAQKVAKRPGANCTKCGYEVVKIRKYLLLGPPICLKDMEERGAWLSKGLEISF